MRVLNRNTIEARVALDTGTAVNIMRPSSWGNPFSIGQHGGRADVIAKYRVWLPKQTHLMKRLHELKGMDLVCCCAPLPCHGDVLAHYVRMLDVPAPAPPVAVQAPIVEALPPDPSPTPPAAAPVVRAALPYD